MIVCLCNYVSDKEIIELAKQGFSLQDIIYKTGASSGCGTCYKHVRQIINKDNNKGDFYVES